RDGRDRDRNREPLPWPVRSSREHYCRFAPSPSEPRTSIIYYRNPAISPFATIQNKGWSVNALSIPVSGIKALSLCPFHGRKRILPAESIPVIDMKSNWHELMPEPWIVDEPAQRRLSGRTTAAALGGKKFEQLNFFRSRLENNI